MTKNASGNGAQTLHHEEWCDRKSHDRLEKDMEGDGEEGYCISDVWEVGNVGGWLLRRPYEETKFFLDQGSATLELTVADLKGLLRATSPENVNDLRGLLTAALAAQE